MKASRKIILTLSGIYLLLGSLLGFAMYSQAKEDVFTEIEAANELATALVDQGVSFPQIETALQNSRHITAVITENVSSPAGSAGFPMAPIKRFVHPDNTQQQLLIFANPGAERGEILTTVYQVFGILVLSLCLSLALLHAVVQSRMKPLRELSRALRGVGEGAYRVQVGPSDIEEIDAVISHSRAMAEALARRESKVHQLRSRLASVQENERQALARELHDNLGQLVTGVRVQSFMLKQQSSSPKFVERTACLLEQQCEEIQSGIRQLVTKLYPVTLNRTGLISALQEMLERWAEIHTIAIRYVLPETNLVSKPDRDMHLYRIVQEALSNIVKHAHATRAEVHLQIVGDEIMLDISDNGTGIRAPSGDNNPGLGLESMRERAKLIHANFSIVSQPGTTITVRAPLLINEEENKNAPITC